MTFALSSSRQRGGELRLGGGEVRLGLRDLVGGLPLLQAQRRLALCTCEPTPSALKE